MTAAAESVSAQRALAVRVPDFFIVGHAKSGTTALYEMLRRHPQIYMPAVKEPQFFAANRDPASAGRFEQTGRAPLSLEQYLGLFAAAQPEQLVGEASTFYLWSRLAPGRIAAAQPGAKIIAILREPAAFLHSLHLQMLQNGTETERDLRTALALESERRAGRRIPPRAHWPEALMYSERVRYVEQLRRYHDVFAAEQVLVLVYDDFRSDNLATLRRVLRFLGVAEDVDLESVSANPTVAVRAQRLDRMWRELRNARTPGTRALKGAVKALTTSTIRRRVLHPLRHRIIYAAPPAADPAVMAELRQRFRPEVAAAGAYIGRDLEALWGYGERS